MTKKLKAIFFDNDGILIDTEPLYFKSNQEVLRPFGVDLTLKTYVEYSLTYGSGMDDLISEKWKKQIDLRALKDKRNKIYLNLIQKELVIMPGAEQVLQTLKKRGLTIGIVTSSRRDMFQAIHQQTGFSKYFDFVVDREDVVHSKPNPEPYLKALKKAKVKADEALVIEDSQRGMQSAIDAQIPCWVIPTDLTKNQDFSKAQKRLESIKEITNFI